MADSWERFLVNIDEVRQIYDQILTIRETCAVIARETRNPEWIAVGQEVAKVQETFNASLNEVARLIALVATQEIKAILKEKTVRPPTGNRPGLQDLIYSVPVNTGNFSFGQVEIGWLSKLNQAINHKGGHLPYWRSQEFGSSHNIGRTIFGSFIGADGGSPPDPSKFRQHPVFAMGTGVGAGPGTINRPIQAKHFLRDGTDVAKFQYLAMVRSVVQTAVAQISRIQFPVR